MRLSLDIHLTKKHLTIIAAGAVILIGGILMVVRQVNDGPSPLPASIKDRVGFKAAYPPKHVASIDASTYKYQPDQKVLTFTSRFDGADITFSEQPAPPSLGSGTQVYYPALGIHPYAQFNTRLGPVALTKFWQSGSLKPAGQAAVLASDGTLIIAHSDQDLTNQQWQDLFDNLKITK